MEMFWFVVSLELRSFQFTRKSFRYKVISLHNEVVSLQVISLQNEVDSPQPVFCIKQFITI